jgi:hypothetical protein
MEAFCFFISVTLSSSLEFDGTGFMVRPRKVQHRQKPAMILMAG